MPILARRLLILLILLVPSAQFAWRARNMPEFGYLHDDGVFFVTAKSTASGSYRIESLPEQPYQTKFPPLFPLFLSLAWRLDPRFPANLPLAGALCWISLGICLALAWNLYRANKFSETRAWTLVALVGLNPYVILFGTRLFSEIFFTCWTLAALIAVSRGRILIAGILGGLAYLSRTAGIALLVSVPAILIWKRQARRAGVFAAAMLPFVAGWMAWTRAHAYRGPDATLIYYTDYVRYQLLNVDFSNLGVVLWKNADQVLYGMGSLVLPKVVDSLPLKILAQVIAVATIAGAIRLARRGILVQYAAFALVSTGILLLWHFPPNERFVLPLYPLLIAGLASELEHVAAMLRAGFGHKDASQRVAAGMMTATAAAVFGAAGIMQVYMTFGFLHKSSEEKAAKLRDQRAAYAWIAANLPESAAVLSYDDTLLYLYSGRRGNYLPLLPRWWYADDHAAMIAAYRDVAGYCGKRGLGYVYFTSQDLSRETGEDDRREIESSVRSNPRLTPIFHSGIGTVFALKAP